MTPPTGPRRSSRLAAKGSASVTTSGTSLASITATPREAVMDHPKQTLAPNYSKVGATSSSVPYSVSNDSIFDLMGLPLEIREMVYDHALAMGVTNVLRACKRVKEEAFRFLYLSAYLRADESILDPLCQKPAYISNMTMVKIQNISLSIDFGGLRHPRPVEKSYMHPFAPLDYDYPPIIHRQTCNITLVNPPPAEEAVCRISNLLSGFVGFEDLFLTFKMTCIFNRQVVSFESRYWTGRHAELYRAAISGFTAYCGPAIVHDGDSERNAYAEFHPYAKWAEWAMIPRATGTNYRKEVSKQFREAPDVTNARH